MALSAQTWAAIGAGVVLAGGFAVGGIVRKRKIEAAIDEFLPSLDGVRRVTLPVAPQMDELIKLGPAQVQIRRTVQPPAEYMFELLKMTTQPTNPQRLQWLGQAAAAGEQGNPDRMWDILWSALAYGFGGSFTQNLMRIPDADAVITGVLAYETVWREATTEERIANLISRHAQLLTGRHNPAMPGPFALIYNTLKPSRKYGTRLWQIIGESGCTATELDGAGAYVLPTGQIRSGRITLTDCDQAAMLKMLTQEVAYVAIRTNVLGERAKLKKFDFLTLFRRIGAVVATIAAGFVSGGAGAAAGVAATIAVETASEQL